MAPSSSSSSSSSSSLPLSKLCFHCREEATQFIKGWKLRSGGFAGLCARCG
uniref:Uncharacterized protein n=1 Tax=Fagus sylvatica TaxID=28930 RepID=A0A2N9IAF4_FAGSY